MNPYVKNPWAQKHPGPYREGDRVLLRWGGTLVEGTIVEDRGNLGVGGRRLYGVRFLKENAEDEGLYIELPPEDLRPIDSDTRPAKNGPSE